MAIKITRKLIVEIGLFRVKNKCAWCHGDMVIKNYNIQLCKGCRHIHLDEIIKKENKGGGENLRQYVLTKSDALEVQND